MTKTTDVAKDRESDPTKTVIPAEYARSVVINHAPSAQALKLMHLMVAKAGGRMADDVYHEITGGEIREIEGMRKHDANSLKPLIAEIRSMTIITDEPEKLRYKVGGFLDTAHVEYRYDDHGDIKMKWWFSRGFTAMAERSHHWAILDRQTVFSLRSKYSILLFQYLSSLFNLKHIHHKRFTVEELRSLLNIEEGKTERFADLNRNILKPSIAELNQLSRFDITITPIKQSRYVVAVEFSWVAKGDASEVKAELDRPKDGRKARRDGNTEYVAMGNPFPASGSLSLERFWLDEGKRIWSDIGRNPRDFPDTKLIADQVRKLANDQSIALDDPKIQKLFENIIKKWR